MPFSILYFGEILLLQGNPSEALAYFKNLPDKKGGGLTKLGGTALAYAALGDVPKTEEYIGKLEAMLATDAVGSAMYFLILVKTRMGKQVIF